MCERGGLITAPFFTIKKYKKLNRKPKKTELH